MYKRLLISFSTLVLATISVATGTRALLSSNVELTTNTLSTGSVNLDVSTNGSTFSDKTNSGFTQTILPGKTASNYFWLKNNASDTNLTIAAQVVNITGALPSDSVSITYVPVDESNNQLPNTSPIKQTITNWKTPTSLGSLLINQNTMQKYRMDISMASDITTSGNMSFDVIFTGTQSE